MRRRTLDGWAGHDVANADTEPRVAFGFDTGFTFQNRRLMMPLNTFLTNS